MKKWQKAISVALSALMLGSTLLVSACGDKGGSSGGTTPGSSGGNNGGSGAGTPTATQYDAENRPLVMASAALDGNFSPFFATSGPDSEIVGQTQLPLMTIDENGKSICGPDEATVALDWKTTYKNAEGQVVYSSSEAATTTYEFVVKNGIRFSDGTPLTIDDVLFNMYVYLDPMYAGSATMYSTDILGLKKYRAQDPNASDEGGGGYDEEFVAEATTRIYNLSQYLQADELEKPIYETEQVKADLQKAKDLFKEEITSDWTECETSMTAYEEEYNFTNAWEVYFFNMGIVSIRTMKNSEGRTELMKVYENPDDPNSPFKYVTTLEKDPFDPNAPDPADDPYSYGNIIKDMTTDEMLEAWVEANNTENVTYTKEDAYREITKAYAIDVVEQTYTSTDTELLNIISYWETASNLRTYIENQARSEYYSKPENQKVKSISGITTYNTAEKAWKNGVNAIALGDNHDVLSITINKVDPKAVYNFSFGVAPMHYYSNADAIANTQFGVKVGDQTFFDDVLKENMKNGLPKGAGPYMASNAKGDQSTVDRYTFNANNIVYFERNPYFYTVGLDGAGVTKQQIEDKIANGTGNDTTKQIHNARIKYLNYKVVGDERIVQNLQAGNIDYGQPNSEASNVTKVGNMSHLTYKLIDTNGYGYVGVNPKDVPDVEVRQAIMKAMNTNLTVEFYEGNASAIYRPISKTSWASPNVTEPYYAFTRNHAEIEKLCTDAGWRKDANGVFTKNGKKLEFKFTIAGESKNHPALQMFEDAAKFLNECGFIITVGTDPNALAKLANGGLAVWAAAWQTGVDPDPYQTYHKDSTATSVKNWNYDQILDPNKTEFSYERGIVNELSSLIDKARETLDEDTRKNYYAQTLKLTMDLAVELPTYQRKDLIVWNSDVINPDSLNTDEATLTPTAGVFYKIWQVNYR